mmetsp:Transcript_43254/g.85670  ORF Transcript_43254/g.85670 Transcript_43254/m.85670 type:complete len:538 (-) Transcript_43254:77-1690(-)
MVVGETLEWNDSALTDELLEQRVRKDLQAFLVKLKSEGNGNAECAVNLSGNELRGPEALQGLLKRFRDGDVRITTLRLHRNHLDDKAIDAIVEHMHAAPRLGQRLSELHLSDNHLTDVGIKRLIRAAHDVQEKRRCRPLWLRAENQRPHIQDPRGVLDSLAEEGMSVCLLPSKEFQVPGKGRPDVPVHMHRAFIPKSDQNWNAEVWVSRSSSKANGPGNNSAWQYHDGGKGTNNKDFATVRDREKGNGGKLGRGRGGRGTRSAAGGGRDFDNWDGWDDWPKDEWTKEWRRGEWGEEQWSPKEDWPVEKATRRDDWPREDPPREKWSNDWPKKEQSARPGGSAGGRRLVLQSAPQIPQTTSMAPGGSWHGRGDWMRRAAHSVRQKVHECKNLGMLKRALNPNTVPDTDWLRLAYNGAAAITQQCAERGSVVVGSFAEDEALHHELVVACAGEAALAVAFRCLELGRFFPHGTIQDASVDRQCASLISAIFGELLDVQQAESEVRCNARKVAEWALLDAIFFLGSSHLVSGSSMNGSAS